MIATTALQMTVPSVRILADAKFPLLLAVVLYYALTRPRGPAMAIAFWAGLLADSLGPMPLGYSAVCFCVVALAAGMFRGFVFEDTWITPAVFGLAAAGMVATGFYLLLINQEGFGDVSGWWLTTKIAGTAVLGIVATPVMFLVARSMDHLTREFTRRTA
ncbi:MAG: rod shape-determining protein MreD [Verrucomicrobia bacterium]|nr:rod shape-determining protein MreD [Verrucomicrobiota bacterium]